MLLELTLRRSQRWAGSAALVVGAVIAAALPAAAARADEPARDPYEEALAARGVPPDLKGITAYLERVRAGNASSEAVEDLIRQLGVDSYRTREAATKKLLEMPVLPEAALTRATKSDDIEVRLRAEYILGKAKGRSEVSVVVAALRTIERKKLKGAAEAVLGIVPLFASQAVEDAAAAALAATVRDEDLPRLRKALKGGAATRVAVASGLAAVLGAKAGVELRPLLRDPSDRVRLEAARALANVGDRASLPVLAKLLESEEFAIRMDSAFLLRALTGKEFGFGLYGDGSSSGKAAAAWQEWVATEGKTAKLRFPLAAAMKRLGRTLLCVPGGGEIVEVDAAGHQTLRLRPGPAPWGVQALPEGQFLVGLYGGKEIVVIDRGGKVRWRKKDLPGGPMSVQRLANGNVLAALSDSNQVVEINPKGEIVWSVTVAGRPADARRLGNGRTLIAAHRARRVVEVDKAGKVVWAIDNLNDPQRAQRLPNGNTLILLTGPGTVGEYDRSGKQVWSAGGFRVPLDAHRLPNGNTLVADQTGLREVDRKGQTVWQIQREGIGRIWRH